MDSTPATSRSSFATCSWVGRGGVWGLASGGWVVMEGGGCVVAAGLVGGGRNTWFGLAGLPYYLLDRKLLLSIKVILSEECCQTTT